MASKKFKINGLDIVSNIATNDTISIETNNSTGASYNVIIKPVELTANRTCSIPNTDGEIVVRDSNNSIGLADGTLAFPSLSFNSNPDCGFLYNSVGSDGYNSIIMSINGTKAISFGNTTVFENNVKVFGLQAESAFRAMKVTSWSYTGTTIRVDTQLEHNLKLGDLISVHNFQSTSGYPIGSRTVSKIVSKYAFEFINGEVPQGTATTIATTNVSYEIFNNMASVNRLVAGTSTSVANTSATNGNVYVNNVVDNAKTGSYDSEGVIVSGIKLVGSGSTSVTCDANGAITISSTDTNTNTNTIYSFSEGTTDGAFSVTPSGGSAISVGIHGLGSAAYTASTAYAASSHTHSYLPLSGGSLSGDLSVTGTITASGNITSSSDKRVKTNIAKIENALDKVLQLNGYTFDRTDIETPRQTGVIAQEVLEVLPEAVIGDENAYSVAYGNMIGLLIEAIKEQQTIINTLINK